MKNIGLTFGWQVTGWVALAGIILVVLLLAAWLVARRRPQYGHDGVGEGWLFGSVAACIIYGLFVLGAGLTWVILPDANHDNYAIDGTVVKVSNSFVSGSGDATVTGFTFTIDTVDDVLRTDDFRIQQLVGEHVNLICTQEWVARGQDYYTCRLNS